MANYVAMSLLALGARMMMQGKIQTNAAEPPTRRGKKAGPKKGQVAF